MTKQQEGKVPRKVKQAKFILDLGQISECIALLKIAEFNSEILTAKRNELVEQLSNKL